MNTMMEILREVTPLQRVFCSSDYDKALEILRGYLPFKTLEFHESEVYNGWVIPPKWDLKEAKIRRDGKVIYDGMAHALNVIAVSLPFAGRVSLEELKKHLHYDHRNDEYTPYHFRQMYRPWQRDWGFCVTKKFYDSLQPGDYDVVIDTEESEGILKLLEYDIQGELDECFVFVSHLDHPGMANDDLAGCSVGVELFRRLSKKKTKFSYKLLLVQEITGSEYYLGKHCNGKPKNILEGAFLEMLGTDTQIALQHSLHETSNMETVILRAMKELGVDHRTGPYESIRANDEYIWETYGVPMPSVLRYPYDEYHSDKDNFSLMSERALNEALEILLKAVEYLETSRLIIKKFNGNICLSNPDIDLYVDPGQIAFGTVAPDHVQRLRRVMDILPTLHTPTLLMSVAAKVGLPEQDVLAYLEKWQAKGLIELK